MANKYGFKSGFMKPRIYGVFGRYKVTKNDIKWLANLSVEYKDKVNALIYLVDRAMISHAVYRNLLAWVDLNDNGIHKEFYKFALHVDGMIHPPYYTFDPHKYDWEE